MPVDFASISRTKSVPQGLKPALSIGFNAKAKALAYLMGLNAKETMG